MNHLTSKFAVVRAGVLAIALVGCGSDGGGIGGSSHAAEDGDDTGSVDASVKKDSGTHSDASRAVTTDASKPTTHADAGSTGTKGTGNNLPCDVQAVITSNCAECHGKPTAFGAPMSLVTLSDFQGTAINGDPLIQRIHDRINDTDPTTAMPPSTGTKLTSAQLATLNSWLAAGAPGTSDTCTSDTTTPPPDTTPTAGDTTGLDCYNMTAHGTGNSKFAVGVAVDSYFNFTFTAPWQGTQYGVLFNPIIDNKQALHHFLLFQNSSASAATGAVHSSGAHPNGQLVYGWAPGGQPLDFRLSGDVGMELSAGVSYTVEYHYNSSDASAQDASGVQLCLSKTKPANIAGISWLGYDNLLVPSTTWTGQCVPTMTQDVHIMGVQPHMHVTGRHMKTVIHRKGGTDETLHDEPFDFNNQIHYLKDVTIHPGDTLTTTCTYSQPMAFGESTGQEMCYLFTFAYAKGLLKDNGAWGSVAHGGSPCLGQ